MYVERADVDHMPRDARVERAVAPFLKHSGRNWPNPVCSFYLPVSTMVVHALNRGYGS